MPNVVRWYLAYLLVLNAMSVCAQELKRSVLSSAGQSYNTGTVQGSWTFGQIESMGFNTGDRRLTLGFQQAYREPVQLLRLAVDDAVTTVGGGFLLRVHMLDPHPQYIGTAARISITASWNATMLSARSVATAGGTIDARELVDRRRLVTFSVPLSAVGAGDLVAELAMAAGLGDDSVTTVNVEAVEVDGKVVPFVAQNATVRMEGICYQGGPRLVDPLRSAQIIRIGPQPASTTVRIELDVRSAIEDLLIRAYATSGTQQVHNLAHVKAVGIGAQTIVCDVSDIPSGVHALILTADGRDQLVMISVLR